MEVGKAAATSDAFEAGVRGHRASLAGSRWGCRNPASRFCPLRDPFSRIWTWGPKSMCVRTRLGGFGHGAKPVHPRSPTLIDFARILFNLPNNSPWWTGTRRHREGYPPAECHNQGSAPGGCLRAKSTPPRTHLCQAAGVNGQVGRNTVSRFTVTAS